LALSGLGYELLGSAKVLKSLLGWFSMQWLSRISAYYLNGLLMVVEEGQLKLWRRRHRAGLRKPRSRGKESPKQE